MIGVLSGPTVPKPWGLPGCIATRSKRTVPSRESTSLTTSYAPTLTPPLVSTRSARISWSSIAFISDRSSSGTMPDPEGGGAGLPGRGGEDVGVRLVDLAGLGRRARLDQLAAGREDHDSRAGPDHDPVAAHRGEQAELPRAEAGAGVEHDLPGLHVLALAAHRVARLRRLGDGHGRDAAVGPLERHHGLGAGWHRRAGHDPDRHAGLHGVGRARPCRDVTDDRELRGGRGAGLLDVGEPHGVAVDGGVVEAGQVDVGDDRLGEDAAVRVEQLEVQRRDRPDA